MAIALTGAGCAVDMAGPAYALKDIFTDTNGTNLPAHTMDVGAGWTVTTVFTGGTFAIQANAAQYTSSGGDAIATADAGKSDSTLQGDVTPGAAAGNCGAVVRAQDGNNFWLARWRQSGTNQVQLYERSSGSWTLRGSASLTAGSPPQAYTISVICSGTSIQATVSGTTASCTNSDLQTQTRCGVYGASTGDGFDNFQVQ
jgi:hypothetical protein